MSDEWDLPEGQTQSEPEICLTTSEDDDRLIVGETYRLVAAEKVAGQNVRLTLVPIDLQARLVRCEADGQRLAQLLAEAEEEIEDAEEATDALRDAIIRAHGMAVGNYVQSDADMRKRIGRLLDKVIDRDDKMRGFLGRGGPRADLDPLRKGGE